MITYFDSDKKYHVKMSQMCFIEKFVLKYDMISILEIPNLPAVLACLQIMGILSNSSTQCDKSPRYK